MKKLLYILLFVPLALFGQILDTCYSVNDIYQEIEDSNPPVTLDLLSGWNIIGYSCVESKDALEVLSPISDKILLAKNNAGSVYMPEFGFNGIGDLLPNQGYQIKMSETVLDFEMCDYHINYHQVGGCTDCEAVNFNQWATTDDGSCTYNKCTDSSADNYQEVLPCVYYGCNDPLAANYDPYANTDDGSCVVAEACPYEIYLEYSPDAISYNENLCVNILVEGCMDNTALNYASQANLDDGTCQYIYGCTENGADNYNAEATTDDGSCFTTTEGCTDPTAGNYDETANTDDGSCLIGGCMNATAENYNADASIDDGTCVIYGCSLSSFPNYNSEATIGDGSCDMNSLDVFGCTDESTWTYEGFANTDNGTCIYSEAQIGDQAHGGIVFYIDETGQHGLVAATEDIGPFEFGCYGTELHHRGCLDSNASNYDAAATIQELDQYGNLVCVFASCDDIPDAEGCIYTSAYSAYHEHFTASHCVNYGGTACNNGEEESTASIADGIAIGTGYQNTLGIVAGCSERPIAASEALAYESGGYSDWYLPSIDELKEMHNTIGHGGPEGNIGGFSSWYWSSSEYNNTSAWLVNFGDDITSTYLKSYALRVRVIRAF